MDLIDVDIPVSCNYEGVDLSGRLIRVCPSDIVVVLDSPEDFRGKTDRHIPYLAMQEERRFMIDGKITPRAHSVAEELLGEIYEEGFYRHIEEEERGR